MIVACGRISARFELMRCKGGRQPMTKEKHTWSTRF